MKIVSSLLEFVRAKFLSHIGKGKADFSDVGNSYPDSYEDEKVGRLKKW